MPSSPLCRQDSGRAVGPGAAAAAHQKAMPWEQSPVCGWRARFHLAAKNPFFGYWTQKA